MCKCECGISAVFDGTTRVYEGHAVSDHGGHGGHGGHALWGAGRVSRRVTSPITRITATITAVTSPVAAITAAITAVTAPITAVTAPVTAGAAPTRRLRRARRRHCYYGDGCGSHCSRDGRGAGPSRPSGAGAAAGGEQHRRRRGARSLASEWPGLWQGRGPPTDHHPIQGHLSPQPSIPYHRPLSLESRYAGGPTLGC